MSFCDTVNLIIAKLVPFGAVRFLYLSPESIDFEFANHSYHVRCGSSWNNKLQVIEISDQPPHQCHTAFSRRIEGILNGLVRDDAGNMVAPVTDIESATNKSSDNETVAPSVAQPCQCPSDMNLGAKLNLARLGVLLVIQDYGDAGKMIAAATNSESATNKLPKNQTLAYGARCT